MRAARYLGVAAWDLDEAPLWWREHALAALDAEARVEQARERRAERRARMSRQAH